jgi:flagellar hook-basal body complex protein FliE
MKEISGLQNNWIMPPNPVPATSPASGVNPGTFGQALGRSLEEVNKLQLGADQAVQGLARGDQKDIHTTMIAMEKADISFRLMMQVRNKVVAAYQEISRMTV